MARYTPPMEAPAHIDPKRWGYAHDLRYALISLHRDPELSNDDRHTANCRLQKLTFAMEILEKQTNVLSEAIALAEAHIDG